MPHTAGAPNRLHRSQALGKTRYYCSANRPLISAFFLSLLGSEQRQIVPGVLLHQIVIPSQAAQQPPYSLTYQERKTEDTFLQRFFEG